MDNFEKFLLVILIVLALLLAGTATWYQSEINTLEKYCEYNGGEYMYLKEGNVLRSLYESGETCFVGENIIEIDFMK